MKALICEMCGSHDIVKEDGFYVCQSCGTKYTIEEAKKLMGTVKIDESEKTENLYKLARRAREDNNIGDAYKYYDMLRIQNPSDWEAAFYAVYYDTMDTKVGDIENASVTLTNCLGSIFSLIKENISDHEGQVTAVIEVSKRCMSIVGPFVDGIWSLYQPNGYYNNPKYFEAKVEKVLNILSTLTREIEARFDSNNVDFKLIIEMTKVTDERIRKASVERTKSEAKRKSGC